MPVKTLTLSLNTHGDADMHNLSGELAAAIEASGLQNGTLTLFCPSSTSAVTTIEYEPGALADLKRLFDQIAPAGRDYAHEAAWGDGNGHSHLRAALLGPSLTIPFVDGRMTLGTWQQVLYVDFDVRPRRRQLVVQIIGE
jgi:secondary thiamine-phosphate synthase enzyme